MYTGYGMLPYAIRSSGQEVATFLQQVSQSCSAQTGVYLSHGFTPGIVRIMFAFHYH